MPDINLQFEQSPSQEQEQSQKQRLIVSQKHQQAIELLQYPVMELKGWLNEQLQENPMLELTDDEEMVTDAETLEEDLDDEDEEELDLEVLKDFERNRGINRSSFGGGYRSEDEPHPEDQFRDMASEHESLQDSLEWQLSLYDLDEEDRVLAELLISYVDKDGFFQGDLEEIAEEEDVDRDRLDDLLELIQGFDPPGIAGRDLEEVLLLQVDRISDALPEPTDDIIEHHLEALQKRQFKKIADDLDVDQQTVQRVADLVNDLEPRPGRGYEQANRQYVEPDIVIRELDDDFEIIVNDQQVPPLHISAQYREMLQSDDPEIREYVRDKLKGALWIINCIYQRHLTIQKVTESIIEHQREFFEEGPTALKPLILKDVAEDIGVHESTVSRAVQDKYVQTSRGMFEMKFFFSSSLDATGDGDPVSSTAAKARIQELIENEPSSDPLSDRKIKEKLNEDGIEIGRRTVSKYRKQLNILPWNLRKRV
jgi:RNA polymerase sigma-54 factor